MKRMMLSLAIAMGLSACTKAPTDLQGIQLTADNTDFAAHWVRKDLLLINSAEDVSQFNLLVSKNAQLDEGNAPDTSYRLTSMQMPEEIAQAFPHMASFTALKIDGIADIKQALKSQLAVSQISQTGDVAKVSYVQSARVLDDLFTSGTNDADEVMDYGAVVNGENTSFALWAPTAKLVTVNLYNADKQPIGTHVMTENENGVWRVKVADAPMGTFYKYALSVYHPRTQKVENLEVTDPYSMSLARNSQYSQVVDLSHPDTQPQGWGEKAPEHLQHPESLILYETHIRDFSASEKNLSNPDFRGRYLAFTESQSDGMKHLQALKEAGLNTVHLLPTYDISTVNEDPSQVIYPEDSLEKMCGLVPDLEQCKGDMDLSQSLHTLLKSYDPQSNQAEALLEVIRPYDPYNWGYDPYHYTVPEGSYAVNPDGISRLIEFRQMVQSLHAMGFRVIMDVVYNHTFASGLDEKSVLDKVVPNYYHRLNPLTGVVEKSTCCENSATENRMMAKLMIDSLVVWARDYMIDGFRFDLMGHQPKSEMLEAREAVRAVDADTYFYGEGWNFGEVANNAQFVQAAQIPLAGTEIGTFTDRLRDAVRGGSSFVSGNDLRFGQGLVSGLITQPNDLQSAEKSEAQLQEYYLSADQVRVGLAGNLANFPLINTAGETVAGRDIDYGGAPSGYALDPADTINYVSKHDNQTLWDNNQYRNSHAATADQRVRMHNLALAYPLMAQGIPFLHMGGELLRSKSFLRDSYDYGDWFNAVDFSKQTNNYNVGLPPAVKDEANWAIIKDLIAKNEGRDMVTPAQIEFASKVFMDFIAIRSGSKLFSLPTEADVVERVKFHNTGKNQRVGLIVMSISDGAGDRDLDPNVEEMVVIFNSDLNNHKFPYQGAEHFTLHPRQASGADYVTAAAKANKGGFTVPGLSAAVFVK